MLTARIKQSPVLLAIMLALACGISAATASEAHAEQVSSFYCVEFTISGAFEDCIGSAKELIYNYASGVHPVCAGAFLPNENVLWEEYTCGGKTAEQVYDKNHLRPVIHNHGTANNEVTGLEEYLT